MRNTGVVKVGLFYFIKKPTGILSLCFSAYSYINHWLRSFIYDMIWSLKVTIDRIQVIHKQATVVKMFYANYQNLQDSESILRKVKIVS